MKLIFALIMALSVASLSDASEEMTCYEYREVVEVIMEDPYLSDRDKETISRRVMRNVPHTCISS